MLLLTIDDAVKVAMQLIRDHLLDENYVYLEMEQKCWLHNDPDPSVQHLTNIIADITPAEICKHIEEGDLHDWCEAIQVAMQMELIKMKGKMVYE